MSENSKITLTSKGVDKFFRGDDRKRLSKGWLEDYHFLPKKNVSSMSPEVRDFRDFALAILRHKVKTNNLLLRFDDLYKKALNAAKNYPEAHLVESLYTGVFMDAWSLEGSRKPKTVKGGVYNIFPLIGILHKNNGFLSLNAAQIEYTKITKKKRHQDFALIRTEAEENGLTVEEWIQPAPKNKKRYQGSLGKQIKLTEKGLALIKTFPYY